MGLNLKNDDTFVKDEVERLVSDVPPAHYIFKIESFSLLSKILQKTGVDKYESSEFQAGGYKWRLLLYPNGYTKRGVNGYVSLYLAMSETNNLPLGWEVNVIFKFYVFDQIRDKYLTLQVGSVRRYNALKAEWGIPRLLLISTLNDPSNGYLIDDCCVFGVDVFASKSECKCKGESLSIISEPKNGTFTWNLDNFSGLKDDLYLSKQFTVGGRQWKLQLYPNGDSRVKGKSLSLYLRLSDSSAFRPGRKLYVEMEQSIKDQVHGKHYELTGNVWFDASSNSWGFSKFKSLSDLNEAKNGFIVNDTLIVEVKITLISVVNNF